jgi:DNA-binding response OmpR family regulator
MMIAIIDRDPDIRELYSLELLDAGYEVLSTKDVESAAEFVAVRKPDLVVLDPYDGSKYRWDVVAEIRNRDAHLPVLICFPCEIKPDNLHLGLADDHIIKSSDVSGLVSKMQSLLATKGPQESW